MKLVSIELILLLIGENRCPTTTGVEKVQVLLRQNNWKNSHRVFI